MICWVGQPTNPHSIHPLQPRPIGRLNHPHTTHHTAIQAPQQAEAGASLLRRSVGRSIDRASV